LNRIELAKETQEMSEVADKEYADRLLGKLFGFPQCCIDFYVSTPSDILRRSRAGLPGLRFCPNCQYKDLEDVVNDLETRRICPQPFPLHPTEADFSSVVSDPRFSPEEQTWLKTNKHRYIDKPDDFHQLLLDYHHAQNQLNVNCEAGIAKEPHRTKYFLAVKELNSSKMQVLILDRLHNAMYKRVIEQVQSGHLKI